MWRFLGYSEYSRCKEAAIKYLTEGQTLKFAEDSEKSGQNGTKLENPDSLKYTYLLQA